MCDITSSHVSCGVYELSGLEGSPKVLVRNVAIYDGPELVPFAFVVFSDVIGRMTSSTGCRTSGGTRLAAYITKHGLGEVTRSKHAVNPNSGNKITVWVWRVNRTKLLKIAKEFFETGRNS